MRWRHLLAGLLVFSVAYPLSQWHGARAGHWIETASAWDARIPFVAWSIMPYMACSAWLVWGYLRLPAPLPLRRYSQRLLLVTALAGVAYNLWPTGFAPGGGPAWRAGPALPDSLPALLRPFYAWLRAADAPHNLLPSLHASYATTLGLSCWPLARGLLARTGLLAGTLSILVSALLTHQHTLADVGAGLLLALAVHALLAAAMDAPSDRSPRSAPLQPADVALVYAVLALLAFGLLAVPGSGLAVRLLGLWFAACCSWVAWSYARHDAGFLRKRGGRHPLATWLLAAPYLWGYLLTWQLDRLARRGTAPAWPVAPGLWVGRRLDAREAERLPPGLAVVDLANELAECPALRRPPYLHVPMLDLVPPSPAAVEQVRRYVAEQRAQGRGVYLHCAMGRARAPLLAATLRDPSPPRPSPCPPTD